MSQKLKASLFTCLAITVALVAVWWLLSIAQKQYTNGVLRHLGMEILDESKIKVGEIPTSNNFIRRFDAPSYTLKERGPLPIAVELIGYAQIVLHALLYVVPIALVASVVYSIYLFLRRKEVAAPPKPSPSNTATPRLP